MPPGCQTRVLILLANTLVPSLLLTRENKERSMETVGKKVRELSRQGAVRQTIRQVLDEKDGPRSERTLKVPTDGRSETFVFRRVSGK